MNSLTLCLAGLVSLRTVVLPHVETHCSRSPFTCNVEPTPFRMLDLPST